MASTCLFAVLIYLLYNIKVGVCSNWRYKMTQDRKVFFVLIILAIASALAQVYVIAWNIKGFGISLPLAAFLFLLWAYNVKKLEKLPPRPHS